LALDIKCLDKLEPVVKFRSSVSPDIRFLSYMDMVSPTVYLTVLYFLVAVKLASKFADFNCAPDTVSTHVELLFSSYDPLEILCVFVGLFCNSVAFTCFGIWKTLANCLQDYITAGGRKNLLLFKKETNKRGCSAAVHFLAYPFAVCSHPQIQHELQDIIEQWTVLYTSVTHVFQLQYSPQNSFTEDLSSLVSGQLEDISIIADTRTEIHQEENNHITAIILLSGNVVRCILEQLISRVHIKGSKMNNGDKGISGTAKSSLGLTARYAEPILT
jgi:telomere-associated protein RIF1